MKSLKIVPVLETSSEGKTDSIYLRCVINKFFLFKNDNYEGGVSYDPIYLGGKNNYCAHKIKKQIKNVIGMGNHYNSETKIIYFIDTDSTETEYKKGSINCNIQEFCKTNGYDLVWFCKNTENVFLGVEPTQLIDKTQAAKDFVHNNGIDKIAKNNLKSAEIKLGCSNILTILSKYLKWK